MRFSSIFSITSVVFFHVTTLNIDAEIPQTNLSCNFDDGTLCRWRSDSDLWLIGVNIPINSYQFIPHSSNTSFNFHLPNIILIFKKYEYHLISDGLYAYAKGGTAVLAEGHLISAEVEEYDDHRAMLSFSYWKTNNISKLDVCIVQQNAFICTYTTPDTVDNELQWIRQKITLSNSLSTPFKIVFRARNIYTPSDIVAIDEIEYNSNDSPKAFISSSISRNEIWEKILPNKRAIYTSCIPIQCTFINSSTCAWTLEAPWHQLEGNIAIDSEGEGLAKSGFFSVPAEAFFEMDVWMSDNALLTVLENMGNKLMIWSRKGSSYNGNGWYRLRIPLKESEKPIQLLLKGTVPSNNFITVSNTKLVNSNGNEIRCGMNTLNSIKSHFNNIERLTAFQQLYTNEIKSTTKILKEEDSKSTRAITNNIMQTQNFYNRTSFTAPMINSNYSLSSNPKIEEIRKPLLTNDKIGKFLKNQSALPFEIIDGSTIQQQHKLHSTLSLLPFRQHDGIDHKSVTIIHSLPSPIINQYTRSNVPVKHNIMKELNALQSQIGGQPALEMQLRQLAQRFGFNQVDAGQNLELLKSVMHSKGLKPKVSDLSVDIDQEQNKKLEPIRPINNISYFIPVKIPIVQKINDIVN